MKPYQIPQCQSLHSFSCTFLQTYFLPWGHTCNSISLSSNPSQCICHKLEHLLEECWMLILRSPPVSNQCSNEADSIYTCSQKVATQLENVLLGLWVCTATFRIKKQRKIRSQFGSPPLLSTITLYSLRSCLTYNSFSNSSLTASLFRGGGGTNSEKVLFFASSFSTFFNPLDILCMNSVCFILASLHALVVYRRVLEGVNCKGVGWAPL